MSKPGHANPVPLPACEHTDLDSERVGSVRARRPSNDNAAPVCVHAHALCTDDARQARERPHDCERQAADRRCGRNGRDARDDAHRCRHDAVVVGTHGNLQVTCGAATCSGGFSRRVRALLRRSVDGPPACGGAAPTRTVNQTRPMPASFAAFQVLPGSTRAQCSGLSCEHTTRIGTELSFETESPAPIVSSVAAFESVNRLSSHA